MVQDSKFDKVWQDDPATIKKFIENRPKYEELCAEISYTLHKRLTDLDINFAFVTHRAKTLESFFEKISDKKYKDPINQITDFAGVRVVYLYQSDLSAIECILENEFLIIEKVDKLNEKEENEFGYLANHYIVELGKVSSGARYDDLKNLKCEIQVRTVLQDAWAVINHHLIYKRENEIPTSLKRKMNSLAGLFETVDNQFEYIRAERKKYLNELDKSIPLNELLDNEINLDSLFKYLEWKFPYVKAEKSKDQVNYVVRDLLKLNFKTLRELDIVVEKRKNQFPDIINSLVTEYGWTTFKNENYSSTTFIGLILLLDVKGWLEMNNYSKFEEDCFKELRKKFPLL